MKSLWSQTTKIPSQKSLEADLSVQNVVIGAGIAGILIAYLLQEKGQEVIVLEANEIASGQTKNTTAKITSQHGLIYSDLIRNTGIERAKGYAMANEEAIRIYKEIITKEGIACHFEELPSFLYSLKEEGIAKLKKEAKAAKSLGITAEYIRGDKIDDLPFGVMGAVKFGRQAQFHPL
jgi:glycine/D-amino acid oxidase-like deaminating enzyme